MIRERRAMNNYQLTINNDKRKKKERAMMKNKIKNNNRIALLLPLFIINFSLFIGCENPFIQEIVSPKKVTFESNGGSSVSAQTVFKNQPIRRPEDPFKSDFIFAAWCGDEALLEEWDFNVIPNADITLYARWEQDYVISSVAVSDITPPSKNAAPDTTAVGTGNFTVGTVSWSPSDNPFKGDEVYTASVTLTANQDYSFAANVRAAINGQTAVASANDGTTVTISFAFPRTEALAVTAIAVATQPSTLSYDYGDLLKLAGLAVTLTYEDSSTAPVAFSEFASKNITTNPSNDAKLLLSHNGTPVVITCNGQTASTNNLTVIQKALTITGASHGKPYDESAVANGDPVTVTLSGIVSGDVVSASAVTAVYASANAGTKSLTINSVTLAGGAAGNYTVTTPVTVDVTGGITKATPTGITWPTSATVTLGQPLSTATFVGGVGDGTFAFNNPTYEPAEMENGTAFAATFTPTNPNYSTLTGSIVVTVQSGEMVSLRGIALVWVEAGSFQMGQNGDGSTGNVTPVHKVTLTQGFWIGKYEVTQEQFQAVMETNPSYFHGGTGREPADGETQNKRPVETVTWYDAVEFCNKLSEMEGLEQVYTISGRTPETGYPITSATVTADWSKNGYRLPTEAQWEYAAKGGQSANNPPKIYSGSDTVDDVAWYTTNSGSKTHEVGKKAANELGLYDMSGNVFEWCWDLYGNYSNADQINPQGAGFSDRVERGGSWKDSATRARSVYRYDISPGGRGYELGFRLLRP